MVVLVLLAMIGVPVLEIAVFIEVGGAVGLAPTLLTVVASGGLGIALLRRQGLEALSRCREALDAGRLPVAELFDGLCLLLAGALLLTPGFVTDGLGLALFVPALRTALRRAVGRRLARRGRLIECEFEVGADDDTDGAPPRSLPR